MKFCAGCDRRIRRHEKSWSINNEQLCWDCFCKKDGTGATVKVTPPRDTVKVTPPMPPIQISAEKPAPPYKELMPHLEQIAKYKQEIIGKTVLSPNKSQKEIIEKIQNCIKNNKTRIVISAPTGCGKSWIAATLASAYGAVILTSTNILQDQYCGTEQGLKSETKQGDFDFMNAVRGKSQYLCELSGNTECCDNAYCNDCDYLVKNEDVRVSRDGPLRENIDLNPEKTLCKYYKADMIGKKSNYSVYSYASYIARMMAEKFKMLPEDKLPERTVLVCDEAHDYDNVVTDQLSVVIDGARNAKYAGKTLPDFSDQDSDEQKIEKTRNFIEEILEKFKEHLENKKNCAKHSNILSSTKHLVMHQELKCDVHNFAYDKKCESCQPMKKFLDGEWIQCQKHLDLVDNCQENHAIILEDVKDLELHTRKLEFLLPGLTEFPLNYVITKKQSNKFGLQRFTVAPLRTAWFTKKILEKFNLCIFMSATINRTIFSKETGIDDKTFEFIDQPSEIPEEQRQIKFLNSYSVKNDKDWNIKAVDKIKEIFDKHPNVRGLIICTQYEHIKNILEVFEKKFPDDYARLTSDEKGSKFKDTFSENMEKSNGVIISARVGTGIDLKDDESRFQIIIKAPYLPELTSNDDIRAKKIRESDPHRFWIKSMFRLVQFAGRSVRGIDDHAETYVLDDVTPTMVKHRNTREHVPDWFFKVCKFSANL